MHASNDKESEVGLLDDGICIGDETYRRRVDDNEVVALLESTNDFCKFFRMNEFAWVRRHGSSEKNIESEVGICANSILKGTFSDEVICKSESCFQTKFLVNVRFANVEVDEDHPFAGQAVQTCKISAEEGLAIA